MKRAPADPADPEDGFVLFEVLVAAAILAMAGTMILLIGNNILSAGQRELDRSVALTNAHAFARELILVGADNISAIAPLEDGTFEYTADPGPLSASDLVSTRIDVRSKTDPDRVELSIDLLVPETAPTALR